MSKRRLAVLVCTLTFLSCTASTYTFKWSQSSHSGQKHLQKYGPRHIQTPGLLEPRSCVYCWLGICGTERGKAKWFHKVLRLIYRHRLSEEDDILDARTKQDARPEDWTNDSRVLHEIPPYVLEYAPLVHLYSEEKFWPCDIAEHLFHVTPNLNYTPIQSQSRVLNLTNLDQLNEWDGGNMVYLTSNDNVEERPDWLVGQKNIPDIPRDSEELQREYVNYNGKLPKLPCNDNDGDKIHCDTNLKMALQSADDQAFHLDRGQATLGSKRKQRGINGRPAEKGTRSSSTDDEREEKPGEQPGGRSDAPAILIVVNKGHGIIDAFWFFFYSYNLGNSVFNIRFGNHVGDWEHTLVRFQHGKPKYVFFSEHNFGSAYTYGAVEKIGKRPVIYSASGTHAMYATPGFQPYILPFGLLHDQTDRGPLWDPLLNSHTYTYDYLLDNLRASNYTPNAPTEWFFFAGHWGDKFYPSNDNRQYEFVGQYHYVSGPLGPRFKNLGRRKVCQGRYSDPCVIKNWLAPVTVKFWDGMGNGEERNGDT